jgi:hypothetical protein
MASDLIERLRNTSHDHRRVDIRAGALMREAADELARLRVPNDEMVENAAAAFAKSTDYYVDFHRGLSSVSADKIRRGIRAALTAALSPEERKK